MEPDLPARAGRSPIFVTRYRAAAMYRGRFAPSPTGDLHLGSAAAALFCAAAARRARGRLVLRMEDIDLGRVVPGKAAAILDEERGAVLVSALLDATNLLLAGKTVVVGRYDALGRGAARRARGFGARVIVVERRVRPAYDAWRDGHDLAPAAEACRAAEIVLLPEGLPLGELPAGAIVAGA